MKLYEVREIMKTSKVWVATKCDGCGKDITRRPDDYNFFYYSVVTHHHDWGNDSIESYESFDYCSMDCLAPHLHAYFAKAKGTEHYEIERKREVADS